MPWTKKSLKQLIQKKLKDTLFVVASNREPYIHKRGPEGVTCIKPVSGLIMALDPVLQASGGIWVAYGSGNADREMVDEKNRVKVPPWNPKYTLRRVWLKEPEEKGYYYGFSNETIWPLSHIVYVKPKFDESDWLQYRAVNEKFAKTILEEIGDRKAFVFVQDYHLTLVPKMLKDANPDLKIAFFWHIPWPNTEAFRINPWKKEILQGMLGADLLGFHINYHVSNFLDTVNQTLEARVDKVGSFVISGGKKTLVKTFPIGVDFEEFQQSANDPKILDTASEIKKEFNLEGKIIGIGTDRIDYTKGIVERLEAIDKFLEKYPEYIDKFTFVQTGVVSRVHIKEYKELNDKINDTVEGINTKYGNDNWKPIVMIRRYFTHEELRALFKMADVCIVSSLHDGMNLVAKEYAAAADLGKGVLLLSQFTGAARELTEAILINPYAPDGFAEAIKDALDMPVDDKKRRMQRIKEKISENNIYGWAAKVIQALLRIS